MFPFQPAKPWEFQYRIHIVFLSLPVMAVLATHFGSVEGHWYQPVFQLEYSIASLILGSIGLFLRLWGTETLSVSTMLKLKTETSQLVRNGPFGMSRNPLYAGTIFILAAFSALYGWIAMIVFVVFHGLRFHRIVLYEECQLEESLGNEFLEYKKNVPRWIPNRFLNTTKGGLVPGLKTLASNGPFVSIVAGLIIILVTKNTAILFPSLVFGLIFAGLFLLLFQKRTPDTEL